MPIIDGSDFTPVKRFRNGHYNTFIPALFLKNAEVEYSRRRINTPDDDFLDIDFSLVGARRAMVICHGLEGSSGSGYMLQYADYFNQKGYDVIAPNYRGCSGEMNRQVRMYNSGTTDDLHYILSETIADYDEVILVGFSLGGNLILKYLGERVYPIANNIKGGISVSAPIHLSNASLELLKPENFAYQVRFLNSLLTKVLKKKKQFPDHIDLKPILKTWNLWRFDNNFTAPMYGYRDAQDYYDQNSSLQFIEQLERPCLLVNALDDPFLGELCYPEELAKSSELLHLCTPAYGGHVGFVQSKNERTWLHQKSDQFLSEIL